MAGDDLAHALAEAARQINQRSDVTGTLDLIVRTAADSLPDIDHVGVTVVHRKGRVETRAASDAMVTELDRLQYELGEGPCLTAMEPGAPEVIRVDDARHEQRWPHWIPRAVDRGLTAALGLRLFADDQTLGALNLYATTGTRVSDETEAFAELFAHHAAMALGHARREETLQSAVASRQVIGQAIGLVMERYGLTQARAFEYLARVSSTSNTKLRQLAEDLVADADVRAGGSAAAAGTQAGSEPSAVVAGSIIPQVRRTDVDEEPAGATG